MTVCTLTLTVVLYVVDGLKKLNNLNIGTNFIYCKCGTKHWSIFGENQISMNVNVSGNLTS